MNYTLLQMTQDILSSMDGDEINSITDTTEASQVVTVIKTVYDDMISRMELPIQNQLFNLDASGIGSQPVLMTKPSTMDHIDWVKYDCQVDGASDPNWMEITYLPLDEFMLMTHRLLPSDSFVDTMTLTVNGNALTFFYRNDKYPQYYTSLNDEAMIFDSFDSSVDSTLQSSKTLAYGQYTWTFSKSDTFTFRLRPNEFSYLYNEAKALAWNELRQMPHPKAEKTARLQAIQLQKTKQAILVNQSHPGPYYGRK